MMRNLTRKIFFSVMAIFLLIMLIQIVVQNSILEDIYVRTKVNKVERVFANTFKEIESSAFDTIDFNDLSGPFSDDLNASVLFISDNDVFLNADWYNSFNFVEVELDRFIPLDIYDGDVRQVSNKVRILIDPLIDELGQFRNGTTPLKPETTLEGNGYLLPGSNVIIPRSMIYKSQSIDMSLNRRSLLRPGLNSNFTNIDYKGIIHSSHLVKRDSGIFSYQDERLYIEFQAIIDEDLYPQSSIGNDSINQYSFIEEQTGFLINVHLGTALSSDGKKVTLLSLTTIENVHDAFKILNGYYGYIFLIQIIMALILVYYFSKKITKPIIDLTKLADDISNQNFASSLEVTTGDELEDLSGSLHSISNRLSKVINTLESNELRMRNMLSGLSHEFKTPLGIISGFLEIVRDGVGDKPDAYYLQAMDLEITRLDGLVRDTIELSELESGEFKYEPHIFSLKHSISKNLQRVEALIAEQDIRIQLSTKEYSVIGDSNLIDQVLINFLSNAIKYSPKSETVSIEVIDIENHIQLSVTNFGVTLTDEALEHIWDRFYRTDKSRHRSSGGSGLGLTIVKNILDLHKSQYGVKNVENGVCFFFTLKLNE